MKTKNNTKKTDPPPCLRCEWLSFFLPLRTRSKKYLATSCIKNIGSLRVSVCFSFLNHANAYAVMHSQKLVPTATYGTTLHLGIYVSFHEVDDARCLRKVREEAK